MEVPGLSLSLLLQRSPSIANPRRHGIQLLRALGDGRGDGGADHGGSGRGQVDARSVRLAGRVVEEVGHDGVIDAGGVVVFARGLELVEQAAGGVVDADDAGVGHGRVAGAGRGDVEFEHGVVFETGHVFAHDRVVVREAVRTMVVLLVVAAVVAAVVLLLDFLRDHAAHLDDLLDGEFVAHHGLRRDDLPPRLRFDLAGDVFDRTAGADRDDGCDTGSGGGASVLRITVAVRRVRDVQAGEVHLETEAAAELELGVPEDCGRRPDLVHARFVGFGHDTHLLVHRFDLLDRVGPEGRKNFLRVLLLFDRIVDACLGHGVDRGVKEAASDALQVALETEPQIHGCDPIDGVHGADDLLHPLVVLHIPRLGDLARREVIEDVSP